MAFLKESSSAQAIRVLDRVGVVEHGYACCDLFMVKLREPEQMVKGENTFGQSCMSVLVRARPAHAHA